MAQTQLESQTLPVGDSFSQQIVNHQESQSNMEQDLDNQRQQQENHHVVNSTSTTNQGSSLDELEKLEQQQDGNQKITECNDEIKDKKEKIPDDNDDGSKSTKQNNSPSFSTAFTISFDDNNSTKKKLNIRDSIRKYAPPKPQTIENPNRIALATLKQNTENSLMSIESAPAELNTNKHHTPTRNRKSASSVSSNNSHNHRANASSNHSSQSVVSDSAAFLIDKMLAGDTPRSRKSATSQRSHSSSSPFSKHKNRRDKIGQHELALDEIDFHDDRSDNGTYVVGTDPDAEAARKRIDEIFGVVKTSEVKDETKWVKKTEQQVNLASQSKQHNSRSSKRSCEKPQSGRKPGLSKERQQHIDRLAYRDANYRSSSVSRSSSSSQNQETSTNSSTNKHGRRQTRNHSCERASINNNLTTATSRSYRRSVSQSSKKSGNSSGRDNNGNSDEDTRSSRSSMSNATRERSDGYEVPQLSTHPNMKFNRAFALRRARLGMETPGVKLNSNGGNTASQTVQPNHSYIEQLTKLPQNKNVLSPTCSFNREDGGRFSLRVQRPIPTSILATKNRLQTNTNDPIVKQDRSIVDNKQDSKPQHRSNSQNFNQTVIVSASASHEPCRNSILSPKSSNGKTDLNNVDLMQRSSSFEKSTNIQLGALDSLVISAISSLSQKIRHSVCDILIDQAKKLPVGNETRLVVEEILPEIQDNGNKGPATAEEIDRSICFDLAKTLRNLKKVEKIVDVISMISKQTPSLSSSKSSMQNSPVRTSSVTNSSIDHII